LNCSNGSVSFVLAALLIGPENHRPSSIANYLASAAYIVPDDILSDKDEGYVSVYLKRMQSEKAFSLCILFDGNGSSHGAYN
jgi:hypothetical protein